MGYSSARPLHFAVSRASGRWLLHKSLERASCSRRYSNALLRWGTAGATQAPLPRWGAADLPPTLPTPFSANKPVRVQILREAGFAWDTPACCWVEQVRLMEPAIDRGLHFASCLRAWDCADLWDLRGNGTLCALRTAGLTCDRYYRWAPVYHQVHHRRLPLCLGRRRALLRRLCFPGLFILVKVWARRQRFAIDKQITQFHCWSTPPICVHFCAYCTYTTGGILFCAEQIAAVLFITVCISADGYHTAFRLV